MGKTHGVHFCAFDMSGQSRYRNLWEHYYGDVQAIITVVDASEKLRFAVVKDELEMLLQNAHVYNAKMPILFLSNKMDLPTACAPEELTEILELEKIVDHPWHIAACDALKGHGVEEAIKWLVDAIK